MTLTQPVLFLSHGGGPSFFISADEIPMMKGLDQDSEAADFLRNLQSSAKISKPKSLLVLSAHWEEKEWSVNTASRPSLYFDYGGFPDHCYKLKWPVNGAPEVAKRVKHLLNASGVKCSENANRGLDHGVFVPLMLAFPAADVPVTELSLLRSGNLASHLKIAELLSGLSHEGVLIIGSGFATHAGMGPVTKPWAKDFRDWLHDVLTNVDYTPIDRKDKLLDYHKVPSFNHAHPSMEHFIPIAMASACAGYQPATILHSEFVCGSLLNEHYLFPAKPK